MFIIVYSIYYSFYTQSQKDGRINEDNYFKLTSTLSTFVELFNLAFDMIVIVYKKNKDILISFSKVDEVTDLKTRFHKPTRTSQQPNHPSGSIGSSIGGKPPLISYSKLTNLQKNIINR